MKQAFSEPGRHGHRSATPRPPLALQIGFAGSRNLPAHLRPGQPGHERLRAEVGAVLRGLHRTLSLEPTVFLTGVSQLAVGADTLFTQAMAELGWPQRVFLPQPRGEFLAAEGSEGPDFQPEERAMVHTLLDSAHVIEERVVSSANTRVDRFQEANLRIVDEADVLICLQVREAEGRPGGTAELMSKAVVRRRPVLLLTLRSDEGEGPLVEMSRVGECEAAPVSLPHGLLDGPAFGAASPEPVAVPQLDSYVTAIKAAASSQASQSRVGFQFAAGVVIGTHVCATLLALMALKLSHVPEWVIGILLLMESALLWWGYRTHQALHNEHALREWAMARLCAEVARSVHSLRGMPVALDHLRQMGVPPELDNLNKTLNVLHLRDNRSSAPADLDTLKRRYLGERLNHVSSGQLAYYRKEKSVAHRRFHMASRLFMALSILALLATLSKLALMLHLPGDWGVWKSVAGPAAILLPVVAVGIMSLATALDWEARAHSFDDMQHFVERQATLVEMASSLREFTSLVLQTEARLLAETLSWFGRRSYVGVA